MSTHEFKAQDKVEIVRGETIHGFKNGSQQIISAVTHGSIFIRNDRGFNKIVMPYEIKLVEPNYSDDADGVFIFSKEFMEEHFMEVSK